MTDHLLRDEVFDRLDAQSALPFLFVGSGVSRRYLELPSWSGLLEKFSDDAAVDFDYLQTRKQEGDFPGIASELAKHYNEAWFSHPSFDELKARYRGQTAGFGSTLKLGVADFFQSGSDLTKGVPGVDVPELAQELAWLRNAKIEGIITTNYDLLLEQIFPEYQTYVGQSGLILSDAQFIGEIYKIHGSCDDPQSLVLLEEDYADFKGRNPYLAAKLLTIFAERPVIFLGYSISDKYIQDILRNVVLAAGREKIDHLQGRLFFVTWNAEMGNEYEIVQSMVGSAESSIPITQINTSSFSPIFEALSLLDDRIPAPLARRFKASVYSVVEEAISTKVAKEFKMIPLESPSAKDAKTIFGFGFGELEEGLFESVRGLADQSSAIVGARGLSREDLIKDAIGAIELGISSASVVEHTLATLPPGSHVPVARYLEDLGYFSDSFSLDSASLAVAKSFLDKSYFPAESSLARFKREIRQSNSDDFSHILNLNLPDYLIPQFLLVVRVDSIGMEDLRQWLADNYDKYRATSNLFSPYGKLVAYMDRLEFDSHFRMNRQDEIDSALNGIK